ncbi:MAG: mycothiol synthase [Hamadaea sp.]|uniref:mycothiol synthase n=1 Tax=Hamadaea sp. TaxID=2024425 RepID=UPI0018019B7A|nr:mycothiol synthase [Hamadaea sp.]NUR74134.1 mycothiol synthase [Hamadaea sp.]NUT20332.1 mycothiol synthase [Hamadaea sp.]
MIAKPNVKVERAGRLTPDQVTQAVELADLAGDVDGAYPLSEHVMLHLRQGGEIPAIHLLVHDDEGRLVGYAHVDPTDKVAGPSAELVVHPLRRRRGLGRALVTAALAVAAENDPSGRLRLWAHGDHPSAGALAVSLGFTRARVLWQMRRSLFSPVPAAPLPAGVAVRAFVPGRDDDAWVRVNARAFAGHPEQGRWTIEDLRVRMTERWFDPDGFFVAYREAEPDGELLGFHWTKIHGGHDAGVGDHQHEPIGEVYVLGVDPVAHGSGLGAALTAVGLAHLRRRGLDQVMLYVDEANTAAVRLYERLGFVRWATDTCFERL